MPVGTPLATWRSRLRTSHAEGTGSIPGRGPKIPRASQCSQEKEEKEDCCLLMTRDSLGLTLTAKTKPQLATAAPSPPPMGAAFSS